MCAPVRVFSRRPAVQYVRVRRLLVSTGLLLALAAARPVAPEAFRTAGPESYAGRAEEAPWRVAAAQRIERYRKGTLRVVVTDRRGKPIPGATVRVSMRRHAFGFGSAVAAD